MAADFIDSVPARIRSIPLYKAGLRPQQARLAKDDPEPLKLSSNENPLGSSPAALQALANPAELDLHRYPDSNALELRTSLASALGTSAEAIVCGNGSSDLLRMSAILALRPGRKAVIAEHAFVCYQLVTAAAGAEAMVVPALNFGHDLDAMAAACQDTNVGVVFVANPNNPTGNWHDPSAIHAFLHKVPARTLIVLDEAYHEYAEQGPGLAAEWITSFANLIVCRTFSKIHGLAGLRLGYGLACPKLAELLERVRMPFNANAVAQRAALAALSDHAFIAHSQQCNSAGMLQLQAGLANLGHVTMPSQGNFISFKVASQSRAHAVLMAEGIIVRNIAEYGLLGWMRTTVGTCEQNERLLAAIARLKLL